MPWKVPAHVRGSLKRDGPSRERHQQDAAWVRAVDDQVRDPMGERVGFARSGASDNEKRRSNSAALCHAMLDSAALLGIKAFQVFRSGCQHESPPNSEVAHLGRKQSPTSQAAPLSAFPRVRHC